MISLHLPEKEERMTALRDELLNFYSILWKQWKNYRRQI